MGEASRRPAEYRDLFELPDNMIGQIVDGELYAQPRPAAAHAEAASNLYGDLHSPFKRGQGGPGGWQILFGPELHLGGHVLVPDVAGWRRERMPRVPDTAWFELPPDWVCEVLSPSTAGLDRGRKLAIYAEQGVPWCWLVDPRDRTLEVFELQGERWQLDAVFSGNDLAEAKPFDAVPLELAGWWLVQQDAAGE